MAVTKSSISAALRRAGYNARRYGPGSTGNPLTVSGGSSGTSFQPVYVTAYSELFGFTQDADPATVAYFAKVALELAVECRNALTAAGYSCTEIKAGDEHARFDVTRD